MKTNIELAMQAGMSIGITEASPYPTEECINRLLELHRAQVIQELATVESGPVAWRCANWSGSPDNYVYRDADDCAVNAKGEQCGEPLYTAEQVAATRAKDAAEIERLKADTNLQTYKEAIKSVRGLREERNQLQAKLNAITKESETNQKWAFLEWRNKAEELQARVKELEADAGRWRFVSTKGDDDEAYIGDRWRQCMNAWDGSDGVVGFEKSIDKAIAARAKEPQHEN